MGLIGPSELILILVVALFLFGPDKIPEMARSLGKAMAEFKKAQIEAEREVKQPGEQINDKETKIYNLAIEMGIDVKNKTSEQLVEEIRSKIKSNEKLNIRTAG
ncbi:MAG TPA: twin-arginine translocase TatA/TatE family subunit [Candidatus Methanoperedens sp.]